MRHKTAIDVANYLLELARGKDDDLTPMQLIKLVYLCHGWMLGLHGRPLITDDVEAWRYGPVIRSLYSKVRDFRDKPVAGPLANGAEGMAEFDDMEKSIMEQVYENYGHYPGPSLSRLTHQEGTPWYITWKVLGRNGSISNDMIEEYFHSLVEGQ